jgi:hypothetical protein
MSSELTELLIKRLWCNGHDGPAERTRLVSLRGDTARDMLNALQSVCSYPLRIVCNYSCFIKWLYLNSQHEYTRKVLRLLVDIAAASNQLPESLLVYGVHIDPRQRPTYGGFADVFHGIIDGQPVAIKCFRINEDGDPSSLRVRPLHLRVSHVLMSFLGTM